MAREYKVRIREILEKDVSVAADSMEHAKELVQEDYENCGFILDASDYKRTIFTALKPRELNYER